MKEHFHLSICQFIGYLAADVGVLTCCTARRKSPLGRSAVGGSYWSRENPARRIECIRACSSVSEKFLIGAELIETFVSSKRLCCGV